MASRRLPLPWILAATALALMAAAAVVLVGGGGDDSAGGDGGGGGRSASLGLAPQGDLPASVHDVVLGALDGGDDRPLHELMDGRPIVVNFFASWCQPCIEEMPVFERVHQDVADEVTIIGLAVPPDMEGARELVGRTGVTYPTYADPEGAGLTFFEGVGMPTTVFLGPDGEVLDVRTRELSEGQLRRALDEHYGVTAVDPAPGAASGSGSASGRGGAGAAEGGGG